MQKAILKHCKKKKNTNTNTNEIEIICNDQNEITQYLVCNWTRFLFKFVKNIIVFVHTDNEVLKTIYKQIK